MYYLYIHSLIGSIPHTDLIQRNWAVTATQAKRLFITAIVVQLKTTAQPSHQIPSICVFPERVTYRGLAAISAYPQTSKALCPSYQRCSEQKMLKKNMMNNVCKIKVFLCTFIFKLQLYPIEMYVLGKQSHCDWTPQKS